jgi:hypothetical protein
MIHNPKEEGDLYWSISDPKEITMVMLVKNDYPFSNYVQVLNTRTISTEMISVYKLSLSKEDAKEAAKTAFPTSEEYFYFDSELAMWVSSYGMSFDDWPDSFDDEYVLYSDYLSDEFYLEFEMANRR